jgi:hypothetical protein
MAKGAAERRHDARQQQVFGYFHVHRFDWDWDESFFPVMVLTCGGTTLTIGSPAQIDGADVHARSIGCSPQRQACGQKPFDVDDACNGYLR